MPVSRHILLIDNNEQSAQDIQRFLKVSAYAFTLSHAGSLIEGINYLKHRQPDLVLLDAALLQENGFEEFKQQLQKGHVPAVLLSENGGDETVAQAAQAGAVDFLVKNKINLFHLQKTIANALKLSETETRLDNTYHEFTAQHESLYTVLNKMNSGVLVLNAQNTIRYATPRAYSIMSEEGIKKHLAEHLIYRIAEEEEEVELKPSKHLRIAIRISSIEWNGERANLFVLDRFKTKEEKPDALLHDETVITLLNTLNENILLLKGDTIVQANKPALEVIKLKPGKLQGKQFNEVLESESVLHSEISVQSFLSEKVLRGTLKIADGSEMPVQFTFKPLNLGETFYRLVSFVSAALPDTIPGVRTDEARFSSGDVLHLASHDLREPVRTILNYVQLISENLRNGNTEEAKEYADFAKSAAARMEKLLSDLKVFIGLDEHPFQLQKVSMKLLLADVLKQLKPRIDELGAEISFTELPDVSADRELVEILLRQLIDNALKFRKKDKKPVIDIGYDKFEGNVIFCVRDNGIGISKKYYQKIFELFEKLNRVDEYPGNGLGLAISRKITDLHGGEIWVESLPGSGSNFYFTLRGK